MIRRGAAALLLLSLVACHARKEQSAPAPEVLYAQGREAVQREEYKTAAMIAAEGTRRFAAEPYWQERFGVLGAECAAGNKEAPWAWRILDATPVTGDPLAAVRRLMIRASTFKPKEANATLLEADALAARVMPDLRPEIATRRSLQLFYDGNADEGMRCGRQAAEDANAPWLRAVAYTYVAHIESQSKPRRFADAIKDFSVAVGYAEAARSATAETRARANLGWCQLELGFFDEALTNLNRALRLAQQQARPEYQHIALAHIADIYIRRLEYDKARQYVRLDLEVTQQLKNPKYIANAFHQLGQLELELGHYDAAANSTAQALANRVGEPEGVLTDRLNQARILAGSGNPAGALEILRSILASRKPEPDAPMRWRAQGIMADIYAQLGQLAEAEQKYEETLATGAQARESVRGTDSSLAFERNLLGFYDNYIQLLKEQGRVEEALAVAERSRARTLRETLGLGSNAKVDPRKLARETKATILYYWVGPRRSLLWTITPDGIRLDELPDDDTIDRAADDYRAELLSRRPLAKSTLGRTLYAKLVEPAKIPPKSRVIILPHAHLNALNFETLIVPEPKPHYWIEDVTISYSPSLRLLAKTPAWHAVPNARALLLGDVPAAGREYPQLKRAGAELAGIAKHFDASRCVILSKTEATPAAYAATAAQPSRFEFIHFAAHATASTSAPLDSSVILAPDPKNGVRLSGLQIVHTPLAAELVTVSSCYSAGGRSYAGEGLVGLAWAFLGAGAHRVVAAQWEVDDRVAPGMMDAMYGAIAKGVEPAEALRAAKLELLHSGDVRKEPLYWAPFVLYGE